MSREYIKSFLHGAFDLESKVDALRERIALLRHKSTSPGGATLGLWVQKARDLRASQNLTLDILELEEELAHAKAALLRLEIKIRQLTGPLNSIQRAVITWRYICRHKWKDITERAEMSEMQIIREHNKAVEIMAKEFENCELKTLQNVV